MTNAPIASISSLRSSFDSTDSSRAALIALDDALSSLMNSIPEIISSHLDYLIDDFHDDPFFHLSLTPRFAEIESDSFDAETLIFPHDLLAMIAAEMIDHDCANECDDSE